MDRQRPLVGRHVERKRLREALDLAGGGEGSLILVAGEAGVGKTRLIEELVEDSLARRGRAQKAGELGLLEA